MAGLLDFLGAGARGLLSAPGQLGGMGLHELQALGLLGQPQQAQQFQPQQAPFQGGIGNDFGAPPQGMPQGLPQSAPAAPNSDGTIQQIGVSGHRAEPPPLPAQYLPPTIAAAHPSILANIGGMLMHGRTWSEADLANRQDAIAPAAAQFNANRINSYYGQLSPGDQRDFIADPAGFIKTRQDIQIKQATPMTAKLGERVVTPDGSLGTDKAPGEVSFTPSGIGVNNASGLTGQTAPVVTTAAPGAVSGMIGAKGSGAPSAISGGRPSTPFFDSKTNSYMQFDASGNLTKVAPGNYNPEDARKGVLGSDQYKEYNNIASAYNSVAKIYGAIKDENGFKQLSVLDNLVRAQTGLSAKQGSMQMMFHEQGVLDQLSNGLGKSFLNEPITPGNIAKAVRVLGGYATSKQKSLNSFISQEEGRARNETGNPNFTFGIQPEPLAPYVEVGHQRVQTNGGDGSVQPTRQLAPPTSSVVLPPHIPPAAHRPAGSYQTPLGVKHWDGTAWH